MSGIEFEHKVGFKKNLYMYNETSISEQYQYLNDYKIHKLNVHLLFLNT